MYKSSYAATLGCLKEGKTGHELIIMYIRSKPSNKDGNINFTTKTISQRKRKLIKQY